MLERNEHNKSNCRRQREIGKTEDFVTVIEN